MWASREASDPAWDLRSMKPEYRSSSAGCWVWPPVGRACTFRTERDWGRADRGLEGRSLGFGDRDRPEVRVTPSPCLALLEQPPAVPPQSCWFQMHPLSPSEVY